MKRIPIILDTDPGVDDTTAIVMSLASEQLELKGIVAVAGNVERHHTANNVRNIVKICGRQDVPVFLGEEKPLVRELVTASHIHGENGMGSLDLPVSDIPFAKESGVDFIYRTACENPGDLRLVTIGPMTDAGRLIEKYPDITGKLHSIVAMGGVMEVGNVTPAAEYNIYADPEAAKIVFDSGIPIVLVGLDVTVPTVVTRDQNKDFKSIGNPVADLLSDLNTYLMDKESPFNKKGAIMHDPLALSYLLDPSIFELEDYYVDVVCDQGKARGMTLVDKYRISGKAPNVHVAVKADNEKFIQLLMDILHRYSV